MSRHRGDDPYDPDDFGGGGGFGNPFLNFLAGGGFGFQGNNGGRGGSRMGSSGQQIPGSSNASYGELLGALGDSLAGFSDGVLFGQGHNLAKWAYGPNTTWGDTSSGFYTGGMVAGIAATSATYGFFRLPATMTHFTTAAGARGIAASGRINPTRWGLFGPGTYMTTIGRPTNLFVPKTSTVPLTVARPSGTVRIIPGLVYLRPFSGVRSQ
jgi:hypothetical protein